MENFGHHPNPNPLLARYCARCRTTVRSVYLTDHDAPRLMTTTAPVPWPCTSAVVLGLVPRPGVTGTPTKET